MSNILDQITFKLEKNEVVAQPTPAYTTEAGPIIETLNELSNDESIWQPALDTIDGKRPFPYWFGADSMEVYVEKDGTWFRDQTEPPHTETKLSNQEARELISRFMEAGKRLEEK
jgi:hypothetical protein